MPPLRTGIKFVLVGTLNSLAGLATIYLAKWLGGLGDVAANVLGYGLGLLLSFKLNRNWTFEHRGNEAAAAYRFALVIAIAYLLNLFTVIIAVDTFHINGYLAQAIGVGPYTVFCYLGSRYFVFRE